MSEEVKGLASTGEDADGCYNSQPKAIGRVSPSRASTSPPPGHTRTAKKSASSFLRTLLAGKSERAPTAVSAGLQMRVAHESGKRAARSQADSDAEDNDRLENGKRDEEKEEERAAVIHEEDVWRVQADDAERTDIEDTSRPGEDRWAAGVGHDEGDARSARDESTERTQNSDKQIQGMHRTRSSEDPIHEPSLSQESTHRHSLTEKRWRARGSPDSRPTRDYGTRDYGSMVTRDPWVDHDGIEGDRRRAERSRPSLALNLESLATRSGGRSDFTADGTAGQVGEGAWSSRDAKPPAELSPTSGFSSYRSSSLQREREYLSSPSGMMTSEFSKRSSNGIDEQRRWIDQHDARSGWKRDSDSNLMRRRIRKVEMLLHSLSRVVGQGLADSAAVSRKDSASSQLVPLQDLFSAVIRYVRGAGMAGASARGQEVMQLVTEAKEICDGLTKGERIERTQLRERIERTRQDADTIIDDALAEFKLLTELLPEGTMTGMAGGREEYLRMRAERDEARQDLAALSEKSRDTSKEAKAENIQLRADLANARIECEQLRGTVGQLEDDLYYHKMQVEQDNQARGTVDAERLKKQLLALRADLLSNRADLLAQRQAAEKAELEKEALRISASRLSEKLNESSVLLEGMYREAAERSELIAHRQQDLEALQREVEVLREEAEKVKAQLEEARSQLANTTGRLEASNAELKEHREEMERERAHHKHAAEERDRERAKEQERASVRAKEREEEGERSSELERELERLKETQAQRDGVQRSRQDTKRERVEVNGRRRSSTRSDSPLARRGRDLVGKSAERDQELEMRRSRSISGDRSRSGSKDRKDASGASRRRNNGERVRGDDYSERRGNKGRDDRSSSRGRDGMSAQDEGRLMALQDHLSDVSHRLSRAEKQREEQRKEANRALGQLEVMRTRISEYQGRIDAEEEATARAVRARDQKDGIARELREQLSAQVQVLTKVQAQRDDLMKDMRDLQLQIEDLEGEMEAREAGFREHIEALHRRSQAEIMKLERELQQHEHSARVGRLNADERERSGGDGSASRHIPSWSRLSVIEPPPGADPLPELASRSNSSITDRVVRELTDKLEDLALKYRDTEMALQNSRAECSRLVSESVTNRLASMQTSSVQVSPPRAALQPTHAQSPASPSPLHHTGSQTEADSAGKDGADESRMRELQDEVLDLKHACARLQSDLSDKSDRLKAALEAASGPAADAAYVRGLEDQLLRLRDEMDTHKADQEKVGEEARGKLEAEGERCKEIEVQIALREQEMERQQACSAAKIAQLEADVETCNKELGECKKALEEARQMQSRDEVAQELAALHDKLQQAEADLASAHDKAAEDLAAARLASVQDMGKVRLEAASRLSAETHKYRELLQEKEAELVAAKLEVHGARGALAEMQLSKQQLTDEVETLRRAHRPCSILIDDLRGKVTSLQADLMRQQGARSPREFMPPRTASPPSYPKAATPRQAAAGAGSGANRSTTPPPPRFQPTYQEPEFVPARALSPRVHSVGIA